MKIASRQNDPQLIRLLAAARGYYDVAQRWHRLRVLGSIVFVAGGVVVTFRYHDAAEYVAAVAGAWILFARTLFDWLERRDMLCGARASEQFDVELFGIAWNKAIAGRRLDSEGIADASRRVRGEKIHDWYPKDADALAWPENVLLCQRASVAWGRRLHSAYAWVLATAVGAWIVTTIIIGIASNVTLADYLLRLFLPSAPALLDGIDLVRAHHGIYKQKQTLEGDIEDLLEGGRADGGRCRGVQDVIFSIRRNPPRVPDWFYNLRRDRDQRAMEVATQTFLARLKERQPKAT